MSNTRHRHNRGAISRMRNNLKNRIERTANCARCGGPIVTDNTAPLCHHCVLAMTEEELEQFYAGCINAH